MDQRAGRGRSAPKDQLSTAALLAALLNRYLDRLRTGSWRALAVYLGIALLTIGVLTVLLRRSNPNHLTIGAGLLLLIYLAVGAFMVLASRVFVARAGEPRR